MTAHDDSTPYGDARHEAPSETTSSQSSPASRDAARDASQLELFADEQEPTDMSDMSDDFDLRDRTVSVRAAVSPGWWPLVEDLVYHPYFTLTRCREVDGRLDVEMVDEHGAPLAGADRAWLDGLRAEVERTCGCCGRRGASARRLTIESGTRVTCGACTERLIAGESYLEIADRYWRLDGSPRPAPVPRSTSGAAAAPPDITPAPAYGAAPAAQPTGARECTALPPDELRALVARFRARMLQDVYGQDDAVGRLALCAALHVGGNLDRGARLLVMGPTGVGKSTLTNAMFAAVRESEWGDLPMIHVDGIDLTSPGWQGVSLAALLEAALAGDDPGSSRARHALIVIDELHHIGVVPDLTGNSLAKRDEVVSSLLPVFGTGLIQLPHSARAWSSREALVIGMGAFERLLDTNELPSVATLVRAGLPKEFASRFEEVVRLTPLPEARLRDLLRAWPALVSLAAVCERLGYRVRVHDEAIAYAARLVTLGAGGASPRTGGGWLVAALRTELVAAMADEGREELAVTPDSLPVPLVAPRKSPPDDELPPGDWDLTVVLTPR